MELQVRGGNKLTVADAAFGREFNEALVHQVVTAYFAGGRQGTKAQKTRSEVSGGGIKPFKQKGSGRARAGTIRSPLWRHGGIIFAAKPRDFGQKVNKKMYQGAIRAIVSELARQERLIVVNEIAVEDHKTKSLLAKLADLGVQDALLVTDEVPANLELAARNLSKVAVCGVAGLNPVTLLRHENVVMTVDAVRKVEEWLA